MSKAAATTRAPGSHLALGCALVALLAGAPGPARGQDQAPDFSQWKCERCPEYYGWTGTLDFGLGWVSDDSLRFGNYRGLEESGAYGALDGDARFRDADSRYVVVRARDLGLDSRQLDIRGGRQGYYEVRLGWHEIPTYRGFGAQTPFLGQGGDLLTLPADWVPAPNSSEMTALADSLRPAPLGLQRKSLDLGLTLRFAGQWNFDIDAQRQEKTGTRPGGGAGIFFNNATLLPWPVDYTTDQVDMGINWGNQQAHVRLGFLGSWFDNGLRSLTWDNPFTSTEQTSAFQAALEPDNEYQQLNLTGAWSITPNIHLSGFAASGRSKQDEAFLPYTINPDLSDLPLPRASLDGKVDVGVVSAGGKFYTRLNSRLSFTARARYDQRDNKTPVDTYTPVTSDFIVNGERENRPYSFERRTYSADLQFRAHRTVRLAAGGKRYELERTLQSVDQSDETTWWGEVKWTPMMRAQVRLKYDNAERDVSNYQPQDYGGLADYPLMRKYNQADRSRNRFLAEVYLTPMDGLGLSLNVIQARDDYTESAYGLQDSKLDTYTFSIDYALADKLTLYGFLSHDKIDSNLFGVNNSPTHAWNGWTSDQITTAGLGLTAILNERARLGLDLVSAESDGDIRVSTSLGEPPYPTLKTDLLNARVHFDFEVNEQWGYVLAAEYEDYSSRDWALDGLGPDSVDPLLTFGMVSPDYSVWHLRAQARYRFR